MRIAVALIILTMAAGCWGNHTPYIREVSSEYYSNNEDKFGFLVFDKKQVDSFFGRYTPFNAQNQQLLDAFEKLRAVEKPAQIANPRFDRHFDSEPLNHDLPAALLEAVDSSSGRAYLHDALDYLFFYECLPNEFKYRWIEGLGGEWRFNVTFFNLLRVQCPEFDKHIYRETFYWDNQMNTVLTGDVYNEITPRKARLIRDYIMQDKAFTDDRLKPDKENFVYLLDKVIAQEWRLVLVDNN